MQKQIYILVLIFGLCLIPRVNYAQVDFNKKPDDDLGDAADAYQELFFEALKQKGIENYDRAGPHQYFELPCNIILYDTHSSTSHTKASRFIAAHIKMYKWKWGINRLFR